MYKENKKNREDLNNLAFWIVINKYKPQYTALKVEERALLVQRYSLLFFYFRIVPYGLAVGIPDFHPDGSDLTLGMEISNVLCFK